MNCCNEAQNKIRNKKPAEILCTFANDSQDDRDFGGPYKNSFMFQADEIDFSRDYQSEPEYFFGK